MRDVVTQNQQSTNRIRRRIIDPVVRVAKPVPIVLIRAVPGAGRYWFAVDRDGAQRASIDSTCDGKILNFCPLRRLSRDVERHSIFVLMTSNRSKQLVSERSNRTVEFEYSDGFPRMRRYRCIQRLLLLINSDNRIINYYLSNRLRRYRTRRNY